MSSISSSPVTGTRTIDRDVPCGVCGYNLRTRAADGVCSECGTPVSRTLRDYAARLAGADRRWLRHVTNGTLWLAAAMLFPCIFVAVSFPQDPRGAWMTVDRQQLAIVLIPAAFAAVGCWLLGAAPRRPGSGPDGDDQSFTRWALRVSTVAWFIPLLIVAGDFGRRQPKPYFPYGDIYERQDRFRPLILTLTWSGLVATGLAFRRLKYVAVRIPSQALLHQCNVIGSQWPLVIVVVASFMAERSDRLNQAFGYAVHAPLPGAGLPWPLVFHAPELQWIRWGDLAPHADSVLIGWVLAVSVGAVALVAQFAVALVRVRRADSGLPAYCGQLLPHDVD
jgi:hypothetical protein